MNGNGLDKVVPESTPLPQFPVRPAVTVMAAPIFVVGLFVFALCSWDAPLSVYGAATSLLLMALCAFSPQIIAFPVNARGELDHRLELARCAGTSWFADIRAQGRCSLLEIGEASVRASQQRDKYAALFGTAAALYLILGVAILAGGLSGWFYPTGTAWACGISASVTAYLSWLAANYRKFGPVAPDKKQVLQAANLHHLCDQERRAELISLIKKS